MIPAITDIIKVWAEDNDFLVIDISVIEIEPEDLKGIPATEVCPTCQKDTTLS